MGLTTQDRETLREEEIARWLVREELKRQKRPQLLVIATVWALSLTALAALFTHLRL
jgi:hypothetical protein